MILNLRMLKVVTFFLYYIAMVQALCSDLKGYFPSLRSFPIPNSSPTGLYLNICFLNSPHRCCLHYLRYFAISPMILLISRLLVVQSQFSIYPINHNLYLSAKTPQLIFLVFLSTANIYVDTTERVCLAVVLQNFTSASILILCFSVLWTFPHYRSKSDDFSCRHLLPSHM